MKALEITCEICKRVAGQPCNLDVPARQIGAWHMIRVRAAAEHTRTENLTRRKASLDVR